MDGIIISIDTSLFKFWETVKDREVKQDSDHCCRDFIFLPTPGLMIKETSAQRVVLSQHGCMGEKKEVCA